MRFVPVSLNPRSLPRSIARIAERVRERQRIRSEPSQKRDRDPRVDFFRGLALWFIFLDHIPANAIGEFTLRNFGFSDATEIFVFISGYSAAIAYGRTDRRFGFTFMTAHVWRRCWQLYVAHLILFVFYTAQIAYLAARFSNPMYVEELNITRFLDAPHIALIEALTLRFRPANLDILPLYIVMLFVFPFALRALRVAPLACLAVSVAMYLAARFLGWNFPTAVPGEGWYFNPFAWQLLFVIGALCALAPPSWKPVMRWRAWLGLVAAVYLLLSIAVVVSWRITSLGDAMPLWLAEFLYPVDKTNLDILRLMHFLALAYLLAHFIPDDARFLRQRWASPLVACGRQSLYVFCLGIFLSFAAHFLLTELNGPLVLQLAVSVAGLALMTALAVLMNWYRARESAGPRKSTRAVNG